MKNRLIILSILICLTLQGCKSNELEVFWKSSKNYEPKIKEFILNPEEAFRVAFNWDEDEDNESRIRIMDNSAYLIIDDHYYFSELSKIREPLTGYYVDGYTGQLEFRTSEYIISDYMLGWQPDTIPADIFDSVEVLIEGEVRRE
jgi:hypothetical protein